MKVTRHTAPADLYEGLTNRSGAAHARRRADASPDAEPPDRGSASERSPPPRRAAALQVIAAALLGSFPVLWVMGALPWRSPTLLVENMFSGFVRCAIADGALNPIAMVCPRAGAPIGMHQLDGGLSYPLGGAFVRLGLEPLAAWKLSVALVLLPGIAALFWLLRQMTGSALFAAAFVGLNGLNGTLTARTWSWYWNITAVVLLPLLFAMLYVLFVRAGARRVRPLLLPAVATLLTVGAIGVEWQYAGLFATAVATGAVAILALLPGWPFGKRLLMVAGGAVGVAVVATLLRVRLGLAGIEGQYDDMLQTASDNAIDLMALVTPDSRSSLLGRLLVRVGQDDLIVREMVAGRQLWVAPYLGVASTVFVLVVLGIVWRRRQRNPGLPTAFVVLLLAVTVVSIVLSTGPAPHVASVSDPAATFGSPVAHLYASDPLRWIRYPWTWGYLTHFAGMLTCAAVAALALRRPTGWSPLVGVLVVLLAIEFISPQVLNAFRSPRPSVSQATAWTRVAADDPTIERFESQAIPELHGALQAIDGPVLLLPWGNTYIAPHLGPESGAVLRNVGIDRNLDQVEAAAPFERHELRRPTPDTVEQVLVRGWAAGVVMLDNVPSGGSILRFEHGHLRQRESAWMRRMRRTERTLARAGYCVVQHSWFTVFTQCADHYDLPGRAGRARRDPAADPGPSADDDGSTDDPDAGNRRNADRSQP